jgi:hypothetical protein
MIKFSLKTLSLSFAIVFALMAIFPGGIVRAETTGEQVFLPALADFAASLANPNASPSQVTGVYVEGVMALPVVQQPANQPGYVSSTAETITQFAAASNYGSTGLLAHNHLAGKHFFSITTGSILTVVYGDGQTRYYKVASVNQYQALSPNSPYSQFINLMQPDVVLSSSDLFYQTYGLGDVLILQTCIAKGNEPSWGRLFIIAEPYENHTLAKVSKETVHYGMPVAQ